MSEHQRAATMTVAPLGGVAAISSTRASVITRKEICEMALRTLRVVEGLTLAEKQEVLAIVAVLMQIETTRALRPPVTDE